MPKSLEKSGLQGDWERLSSRGESVLERGATSEIPECPQSEEQLLVVWTRVMILCGQILTTTL